MARSALLLLKIAKIGKLGSDQGERSAIKNERQK
jgi:hypothetical protein